MSLRRFIQRTQLLIQHGLHQTRSSPILREAGVQAVRLEERLLFSASPVAAVAVEAMSIVPDAVEAAPPDATSLTDEQLLDVMADSVLPVADEITDRSDTSIEAAEQRTFELVIVDSSVSSADDLIASLRADAELDQSRTLEFITLDGRRDGIAQITATLLRYDNIDGLHIVSHGSPGQVRLGSAVLSMDTLATYESAISAWRHSLSDSADVLIYGCDVSGSGDGIALVNRIADLTAADVAASTDLTGHESLGGDWELETVRGIVESRVVAGETTRPAWFGTLDITTGLTAKYTFDSDASDSSGNGLNGTLTNGAVIDTDSATKRVGVGKLSLDGSDDYVDLSSHISSFSGLGTGTIAAWIRPTASSSQVIFEVSDRSDIDSRLALINDSGGRLQLYIREGSTTLLNVRTISSVLPLNQWTHVAVTVNSGGNKLYINGAEVASGDLNYLTGNASTTRFMDDVSQLDFAGWGVDRFSGTSFGQHFAGFIDASHIFSRALTASDVNELFGDGPAGITVTPTSGLITTEAGGTAQFTVVLDSAPTSNVTIGISSSDTTEGTVSTSTLTFTSSNWYVAQTVTVTGVNDVTLDGDVAYSILTAAASSSDAAYNGLAVSDVSVTNQDNDSPNTLTVDTVNDVADGNTSSITALLASKGADGRISLREAITAANNTANAAAGADQIHFNIAGAGPHTINLSAALPSITDAIVIDATTEPDYAAGALVVVINGSGAGGASGLILSSGSNGSAIRGLIINSFSGYGIQLDSALNTIDRNWIGIAADGTTTAGNGNTGLLIQSSNNQITRNVISASGADGVLLWSGSAVANTLTENYIGTDVSGSLDRGNTNSGITMANGAAANVIGAAGLGNVISGNSDNGIAIFNSSTTSNVVRGNRIGTTADGLSALGNSTQGIWIGIGTTANTIGGTAIGEGNLISGNTFAGVEINGAVTTGTVVVGNVIGLNATGSTALANGTGVYLQNGATGNRIGTNGDGTNDAAERNVISGNTGAGVWLLGSGTIVNTVAGNYIGTDITGTLDRGNGQDGVIIGGGATLNTIGGSSAGMGNVISGNNEGIELTGSGTSNNNVQGNIIGLSASGTAVIGNDFDGIHLSLGASSNTIGGSTASARNVIAANGASGIQIEGSGTSSNSIAGNYIGTDITGAVAHGNTGHGVLIGNNATSNVIGGTAAGSGNVISGNISSGVVIDGEGSDGNVIQGNRIGINAAGTAVLGNAGDGIRITNGADNTIIGGSGANEGNWISAPGGDAIEISGTSLGTVILGNRIGTDATGTLDWGSRFAGISIENVAGNTVVGGTAAGEGNIIAFAGRDSANANAITLWNTASTGITIVGNSIYGQDGLGIDLFGDGVSANDPLDADGSVNFMQNTPVVTSATTDGTTIVLSGTINTLANVTGLILHFYASPSTGSLTRRDAKRYLGATTVNTDGSGNATFTNVSFSQSVAAGELITATATSPGANGNTSELSQPVVATLSSGNATPSNIVVTGTANGGLNLNTDGGDDAILVASNASAVLGGRTALTAEVQFSSTQALAAGDEPTLMSYATSTFDNAFRITIYHDGSGSRVRASLNNSTVTLTTFDASVLFDGTRHQVGFSWSNAAGGYTFYVDGAAVGSGSGLQAGAAVASGGTLVIGNDQDVVGGQYAANQAFRGTLHDIRFFNDVRTAAEIASGLQSTLPHNTSGLVANWRFQDLTPDGATTDSVAGNNLHLMKTGEAGFTSSTPALGLEVTERVNAGTIVGTVTGIDIDRDARITQLLAADQTLRFSAETGKFYKLVSTTYSWTGAQANAIATTLNGVSGQLMTVRNGVENGLGLSFLLELGSDIYLGLSDAGIEGAWRLYDGATPGPQIWQGISNGYAVNGAYTKWAPNEPNDSGDEDYAVMYSNGQWNDTTDANLLRSVIEWDADTVLDATTPLTYSITSQSVAGAFAIDTISGVIKVADGNLLNTETATTQTITVRVSDGTATFDRSFTIAIRNLVHEPLITVPTGQTTPENTVLVFSTANGNAITVTDQDGSLTNQLQVSLSVANGTLTLASTTGLTFIGGANGSSAMAIEGSENDLNAALNGLQFNPNGGFSGSVNLQASVQMGADLRGYYTFDTGNADDTSLGVADHGTLFGNATVVNDATRGPVLSLDGSGDYARVTGLIGQPVNSTLAAWVNLNQTNVNGSDIISLGDNLILRADQAGGLGVSGVFYDGTSWISISSERTIAGTGWHHIAFTFNDGLNQQALYIDGVLVATGNSTASVTYTGGDTYIGRHGGGTNFNWDVNGLIDDARVYTRALSATEIAHLFTAPVSDADSVTINVTAANDAPVLDNSGTMTLDTINEDQLPNVGTSVADIIASAGGNRITDADAGAVEGIAITSVDNSNGTWFYSTDGTTWWSLSFRGVSTAGHSDNAAVLLSSTSFVRFDPNPSYNGSGGSITFRAWDQTSGSDGAFGITTVSNGGTTAFSTAVESASITILPVNDAPVASMPGGSLTYVENAAPLILDATATVSDIDSTNFDGGTLTATIVFGGGADDRLSIRHEGNGAGQIGVSAGTVSYGGFAIGTFTGGTSASDPLVITLNASATPTTVQALARNITWEVLGESPSTTQRLIRMVVTDGDGGTSNNAQNLYDVTSVNDAPIVYVPVAQSMAEDSTLTLASGALTNPFINTFDEGSAPLRITLTAGNGTLTLFQTTGLTFITGDGTGDATMTFEADNTSIYYALDGLRFTPTNDYHGLASITITADDLGSTGTGGALSDSETLVITVTPVNDLSSISLDPDNSGGGPDDGGFDSTFIEGGSAVAVTDADAVINDFYDNDTESIRVSLSGFADIGSEQLHFSAMTFVYGTDSTQTELIGGTTFQLDYVSAANEITITQQGGGFMPSADLRDLLRNVTYENTSASLTAGNRQLGFFVVESGSVATDSAFATINVQPTNDAPVITSNGGGATAAISIAENTIAVTTATATDIDLPAQTLAYSIVGGADAALFSIDSATGALSFVSGRDRETPTDADSNGVYDVTVHVTDGLASDTQAISVTVTDVNEFNVAAPTDSNAAANAVVENASNGATVGLTASAIDNDATNNTVTYSLLDDAGGRFAIDSITGAVAVADGSLLDRESAASWDITIQALSSDGSTASSIFTIAITDADEFDITAISDVDASVETVGEDASIGAAVGITASASDADATNNSITWTLDDNASGRFAIDSVTGIVTVAGALDFETNSNHSIIIRGTSADGSFSTRSFTIAVTNANEGGAGTIIDANPIADQVTENVAIGSTVGIRALATDPDPTDLISYSLDDSAGGRFTIDPVSGTVTVAGVIDCEVSPNLSIIVRATSTDGSFSLRSFIITVGDVDEFDVTPPADVNAAQNAVDENAANGTIVGITANATDADATTNLVRYSLTDDASGRFTIDANTGVVTVADGTLLDREAASSHAITVRATSADGSFAESSFTIAINDVNESGVSAITDTDPAADFVVENAVSGATVGFTTSATDPDTSDTISYSLDVSAGGRFVIDSMTGVVTVNGAIDREVAGSHAITVRATSTDGSFVTRVVTIAVGDVDEFDTGSVTDANPAADTVQENAANGTIVGITANAIDADATTNLVTYSLTDNAGGRFAIDVNTGVVTVANGSLLDTETAAAHGIIVRATSTDGSFAESAFTIAVTNVNEPPALVRAGFTIAEGQTITLANADFAATDTDHAASSLTWTISGLTGGRFERLSSPGTAITSFTQADIDAGQIVFVHNGSEAPPTFSATVTDGSFTTPPTNGTVNFTNVNDAPVASNATFTIPENSAVGTFVGSTVVSDPDAGDSFTWTITADNSGGSFAIDATTGTITVADATRLDFEVSPTFSLTVMVRDAAGTTSSAVVTITLSNANDAPTGTSESYWTWQYSSLNVAQPGVLANDLDQDGNTLTASLVSGPATGTLTFNADGSFSFSPDSDFDGIESFAYQIFDGSTFSSPITVTIDVRMAVASGGGSGTGDGSGDGSGDAGDGDGEVIVEDGELVLEDGGDNSDDSGDSSDDDGSSTTSSAPGSAGLPGASAADGGSTVSTAFVMEAVVDPLADGSSLLQLMLFGAEPGSADNNAESNSSDSRSQPSIMSDLLMGFGQGLEPVEAIVSAGLFSLRDLKVTAKQDVHDLTDLFMNNVAIGSTAVVGTSLTMGYVIWILRGGSLLAAFVSALPAWQSLDPLPVLQSFERRGKEDDESLLSLVRRRTVGVLRRASRV